MSQTAPPILSVVPSRALVDEEFKVVVENLPPGSPVTLHSLHHSEDKNYWEAYGHYISDHRGMVSGGWASCVSHSPQSEDARDTVSSEDKLNTKLPHELAVCPRLYSQFACWTCSSFCFPDVDVLLLL